jgi:hypothetical protein
LSHLYELGGVRLRSEVPLATLRPAISPAPATDDRSTLAFRVDPAGPRVQPSSWLVVRSFEGDDRPWLSVARLGDAYLLRVHDYADFLVDATGASVRCTPEPGCDLTVVEQLFLDQILPQVLHLRGTPSLHASAVAWDGHAVAFAGRSGFGKSTLAGSLGASRPLVSDDCLVVKLGPARPLVEPSYAAVRLWPDAARALFAGQSLPLASPRTAKLRVALPPQIAPLPLRCVLVLALHDAPPAIEPIGRRDALVALAEYLHRLDPFDRRLLAHELDVLERLVTTVPVARLAYRRRFEELPLVHDAIAAHVARIAAGD